MLISTFSLLLGVGWALSPGLATSSETFWESLTIQPLLDDKVAFLFVFSTTLVKEPPRMRSDHEPQHYEIFPLALGEILQQYDATELHLTLNSGSWNYEQWGYPDEIAVSSGADMWAMIDAAETTVELRWKGVRNALAGLFCASLGSYADENAPDALPSSPKKPLSSNGTPTLQLRHTSLPSERICTENLTPFLRLLPCKSRSGIARLLNPRRLFDADWHGMGIHASRRPDESIAVNLTFQAVFDPIRYSSDNRRDWSLKSIFDRTIDRLCPISRSSRILVQLPFEKSFSPWPSLTTNELPVIHDLNAQSLHSVTDMPFKALFNDAILHLPDPPLTPLSLSRILRGSTQDRGELVVTISNELDTEANVLYMEKMPWLLQFHLHRLRLQLKGQLRNDLITNLSYIAPLANSRPTTLQCALTLPPKSTVHLTIDVTKSFLRRMEHPPDAQRGWDIAPAVLLPIAVEPSSRPADSLLQIYSPPLLVDPATPDFSMPYNVIILTCSLLAFIFGSIFNLLTRKFVVIQIHGT